MNFGVVWSFLTTIFSLVFWLVTLVAVVAMVGCCRQFFSPNPRVSAVLPGQSKMRREDKSPALKDPIKSSTRNDGEFSEHRSSAVREGSKTDAERPGREKMKPSPQLPTKRGESESALDDDWRLDGVNRSFGSTCEATRSPGILEYAAFRPEMFNRVKEHRSSSPIPNDISVDQNPDAIENFSCSTNETTKGYDSETDRNSYEFEDASSLHEKVKKTLFPSITEQVQHSSFRLHYIPTGQTSIGEGSDIDIDSILEEDIDSQPMALIKQKIFNSDRSSAEIHEMIRHQSGKLEPFECDVLSLLLKIVRDKDITNERSKQQSSGYRKCYEFHQASPNTPQFKQFHNERCSDEQSASNNAAVLRKRFPYRRVHRRNYDERNCERSYESDDYTWPNSSDQLYLQQNVHEGQMNLTPKLTSNSYRDCIQSTGTVQSVREFPSSRFRNRSFATSTTETSKVQSQSEGCARRDLVVETSDSSSGSDARFSQPALIHKEEVKMLGLTEIRERGS